MSDQMPWVSYAADATERCSHLERGSGVHLCKYMHIFRLFHVFCLGASRYSSRNSYSRVGDNNYQDIIHQWIFPIIQERRKWNPKITRCRMFSPFVLFSLLDLTFHKRSTIITQISFSFHSSGPNYFLFSQNKLGLHLSKHLHIL
jgi:hypothetical protein